MKMSLQKSELIISLDQISIVKAMRLIIEFGDLVSIYKVSYITRDPEYLKLFGFLKENGKQIFLDYKFHDIPNTMLEHVKSAQDYDFFSFHLFAGFESTTLIADSFADKAIGVSVLTSLCDQDIYNYFGTNRRSLVLKIVKSAYSLGIRNFVCSPWELKELKSKYPKAKFFVPAARFEKTNLDQKMSMYIDDLILLKPHYLIIGRSIIQASSIYETRKQMEIYF
jgi:orotidine-5'-phosphate decarboxylase